MDQACVGYFNDYDSDGELRQVLLISHPLVDCDEHVEGLGGSSE